MSLILASRNDLNHADTAYANDWTIEPAAKRRRLVEKDEVSQDQNDELTTWVNAESSRHRRPLNTDFTHASGGNNTYGTATVSDNAHAILGNQYQTNNYYNGHPESSGTSDSKAEQTKRLIDSLTFKRMDARLHNIATAFPKTCTWLYKHKVWKDWIDDDEAKKHHGFMWIKGKPGCGKSTVIRGALGWANKNRSKRKWVTISYFFNARVPGELEKSTVGLYRSLVYQVIQTIPEVSSSFHNMFSWKCSQDDIEWTITELQEYLIKIASSHERPPMCIFIDALDEGDEDEVRGLISFLESLSDHAEERRSVRVCFSSRHYPLITIDTALALSVEDQKDHDRDIETYIRAKLKVRDTADYAIHAVVCHKSAGIFLWVVLVVPILNQLHDRGKAVAEIAFYLDALPGELERLFAEILSRDADEVRDCVSLLQWVLYAFRPLHAEELYLAVQHSWARPDDNPVTLPNHDSIAKSILHNSRGLVEVTKSEPPVIQFIHETVREFLVNQSGLAQVDSVLKDNLLGWSHAKLAQVCFGYMTYHRPGIRKLCGRYMHMDTIRGHHKDRWPFLQYAAHHVLRHADVAERHYIPQMTLLTCLMQAEGKIDNYFACLYNTFERFEKRQYRGGTRLLYVCADMQLPSLTSLLVRNDAPVNATCYSRYNNALQAACYRGNAEIVRELIEAGADVNQKGGEHKYAIMAATKAKHFELLRYFKYSNVPLSAGIFIYLVAACAGIDKGKGSAEVLNYLAGLHDELNMSFTKKQSQELLCVAAAGNHIQLVHCAIRDGADVNEICHSRFFTSKYVRALHIATEKEHTDIVRILLHQYRADPNVIVNPSTALSRAAANGNLEIALILLDSGANPLLREPLARAAHLGHISMAQLLLQRGADAKNDIPAFVGAAAAGHVEIAKLLLAHGAAVDATDDTRATALWHAVYYGRLNMLEFLLDCGASVAPPRPFEISEGSAKDQTILRAVELLTRRGADVDSIFNITWGGMNWDHRRPTARPMTVALTPLTLALACQQFSSVEFLLCRDASCNFTMEFPDALNLRPEDDKVLDAYRASNMHGACCLAYNYFRSREQAEFAARIAELHNKQDWGQDKREALLCSEQCELRKRG